jgi:hypothetical protein
LDDCYEEWDTCSERGDAPQMNCLTCKNDFWLVEGIGNCIENRDTIIDFYFKTNDNINSNWIYKKCYKTCKTCSGEGDILHHRSLTCKDKYQFDPSNSGNCVKFVIIIGI